MQYDLSGSVNDYTTLDLALMVLAGFMGTGKTREERLGDRYPEVQDMVNRIISEKKIPAGEPMSGLDWSVIWSAAYNVMMEMKPSEEEYENFAHDFCEALGREIT